MADDTAPHRLDRLTWQAAVVGDPKLTPTARLLALVLLTHFNFGMGSRWKLHSATLMAEMGIKDPKTLTAASKELQSAGFVIVKRLPGASEFAAALPEGSPKNGGASRPKVHRKTVSKVHRKTVDPVFTDPSTDQEIPTRSARTGEPPTPPEAEDMTEAVQLPMLATLDGGKLPATRPQTVNQRANVLARIYSDAEPLSHFMATRGIVARAVKAGYTDEQIRAALLQLVAEGRPLTLGTLRYRLNPPKARSTTDERVEQTLALKARLPDGAS